MNKGLKLEAIFRNLDLGLSSEKEWLIDSMGEVGQKIKEVMDNEHYDAAEVKLSHWSHEKMEWRVCSEKTYYNCNTKQEYMLLNNGSHEHRLKHSHWQELVIHLESKITFFIDNSQIVGFAPNLLNEPEVLFYKFKYHAENGMVFHFVVYCNLCGCNYTPEQLSEIKQTILKPGAQWFCDHFSEKYRLLFGKIFD